MRLTKSKIAIREDNPICVDVARLKDAQKHRLPSQNEDCHSKKTFPGASSGTALVQKKGFCEDTGIHFLVEVFVGFVIGVTNREVH